MKKTISIFAILLVIVLAFSACTPSVTVPAETPNPQTVPGPLPKQADPTDDGKPFDYTVCGAISSNMVFQRNQYINVYGTADAPGSVIYADFMGETRWGEADEQGDWVIQFDPKEASKDPVELKVYNKAQGSGGGYNFSNILIGDVWMVAGQSNVQVTLASTLDNNPDFINTVSPSDNIRVFTQFYWDCGGTYFEMNEDGSDLKTEGVKLVPIDGKPLKNTPAGIEWQVADQEVAKGFSAVGYYFAKMVADNTGIPIGMVQVVAGGAAICDFMPPDKYDKAKYNHGASLFNATDIYNCLMAPFANTSIAGMLWYQGEANEGDYDLYAPDLKAFIGMMREIYGSNMPFYDVQITSHNDTNAAWPNIAEIRYQQASLIGQVDNYYCVCTMDHGSNGLDTDWAHPRNKKHIGDRLGWVALSRYYNDEKYDIEYYGSPAVVDVQIKGKNAYVYYKYVGDGLKTADGGKEVLGFYSRAAGTTLSASIVSKNCVKVVLEDRNGDSFATQSFRLVYGSGAMADDRTCNLQNSNDIGALAFDYVYRVD